ncbi:MAG: hypothetical protein QM742_07205 [Aquabacterium sp.]
MSARGPDDGDAGPGTQRTSTRRAFSASALTAICHATPPSGSTCRRRQATSCSTMPPPRGKAMSTRRALKSPSKAPSPPSTFTPGIIGRMCRVMPALCSNSQAATTMISNSPARLSITPTSLPTTLRGPNLRGGRPSWTGWSTGASSASFAGPLTG